MKYFRAYCRWFLITFGIAVGGLFLCGFIAIMLAYFFDPESQFVKVCFYLLIIPVLISFLLGVGLGDIAFRRACAQTDERSDSSLSPDVDGSAFKKYPENKEAMDKPDPAARLIDFLDPNP